MYKSKSTRCPSGRRRSHSVGGARDHESLIDVALWALDLADRLTADDPEDAERVERVRIYVEDLIAGRSPEIPTDDIAFVAGVLCAAIDLPGGLPPLGGACGADDPGEVHPVVAAPCSRPVYVSPIGPMPGIPHIRVRLLPRPVRRAPVAPPFVVVLGRRPSGGIGPGLRHA